MRQRSHYVHEKKKKNHFQKPIIKQKKTLNTLPKASSTPHKPRAKQLFNNLNLLNNQKLYMKALTCQKLNT